MTHHSIFVTAMMLATLLVVGGNTAHAATISSPLPFVTQNTGWQTSGLELQALDNSTLTSLTFMSEGHSDTIELIDVATNNVQTASVGGGSSANVVSVNWNLVAGQTYNLIQTTISNSQFTANSASPLFPYSDSDLTVQGAFFAGNGSSLDENAFVAFDQLVTAAAPVPLPAAAWLLLSGLGGLGLFRKRRKLS